MEAVLDVIRKKKAVTGDLESRADKIYWQKGFGTERNERGKMRLWVLAKKLKDWSSHFLSWWRRWREQFGFEHVRFGMPINIQVDMVSGQWDMRV